MSAEKRPATIGQPRASDSAARRASRRRERSAPAHPVAGRFLLAPSIDLLQGRVVRLEHGDPARATVYERDPVAAALRWAEQGADLLHIVDLDGAFAGRMAQHAAVTELVAAASKAGVACEVGGGIRDETAMTLALATGAQRVVLGTALLADPSLAAQLVLRHGSARLVAALDVRDGMAIGEGWGPRARGLALQATIAGLLAAGVVILEVTAIARDGTLNGPDFALLAQVRHLAPGASLIASGGIRNAADLRALRDLGCDGAILGRALYEGTLTLQDARAALREAD
jgi:phosphoribosylformimino-5-aminoimidazole carboxamide ribotide isomerase